MKIRQIFKKPLTFECVVCNKLIEHPVVGSYTCDNEKCRSRYKTYTTFKWRHLDKPIKDPNKKVYNPKGADIY